MLQQRLETSEEDTPELWQHMRPLTFFTVIRVSWCHKKVNLYSKSRKKRQGHLPLDQASLLSLSMESAITSYSLKRISVPFPLCRAHLLLSTGCPQGASKLPSHETIWAEAVRKLAKMGLGTCPHLLSKFNRVTGEA